MSDVTSLRIWKENQPGLKEVCRQDKRSQAWIFNYALSLYLKQRKAPKDRS